VIADDPLGSELTLIEQLVMPSTVVNWHEVPIAAVPAFNWTVPVAFVVVVAVNVTDDPFTDGLASELTCVAVGVNAMAWVSGSEVLPA